MPAGGSRAGPGPPPQNERQLARTAKQAEEAQRAQRAAEYVDSLAGKVAQLGVCPAFEGGGCARMGAEHILRHFFTDGGGAVEEGRRPICCSMLKPGDMHYLARFTDCPYAALRSQGPSPVPAGGAARLRDVLGSLYMGFWAGRVFKCKRRQEHT